MKPIADYFIAMPHNCRISHLIEDNKPVKYSLNAKVKTSLLSSVEYNKFLNNNMESIIRTFDMSKKIIDNNVMNIDIGSDLIIYAFILYAKNNEGLYVTKNVIKHAKIIRKQAVIDTVIMDLSAKQMQLLNNVKGIDNEDFILYTMISADTFTDIQSTDGVYTDTIKIGTDVQLEIQVHCENYGENYELGVIINNASYVLHSGIRNHSRVFINHDIDTMNDHDHPDYLD
jgi:hypothetical protein